jgi:hypothetical protein
MWVVARRSVARRGMASVMDLETIAICLARYVYSLLTVQLYIDQGLEGGLSSPPSIYTSILHFHIHFFTTNQRSLQQT